MSDGPTRGQVRRAIEWESYLARSRFKRGKETPRCVTCGGASDHEYAKGEPAYACHHEPLRIADEILERGRREFGRR